MEAMGGNAAWNESTQTVILTYKSNEIRLIPESLTAYLNDMPYTLETAPTVINDRIMLPIRFIAEKFKFAVDWNEKEQIITITKNTQQNEAPAESEIISSSDKSSQKNSSRALVLYFSATGNTKALAEKIAAAANSDICEIIPENPYTSADLNYTGNCRANSEQQDDNARPAIKPVAVNIDDYDTVILGYPIWWGTLPKVIYTFTENYDLSGKTIIPFCTSGGSGIASSISVLRKLCPNSSITDGFRGTNSTGESQINLWFSEIGFEINKNDAYTIAETDILNIHAGETVFTAVLAENSSADALKELLAQGPLTINMSDYGNFEKVGSLGADLPRNDKQITAEPGDLILYLGNSFVIYYGTNSWNFTRLGKINNASQSELRDVLGSGNITITLSMD